MQTYKEIVEASYNTPFDEIKVGSNYKNVCRASIDSLKASLLEEEELSQNPQVIPILLDARYDHEGVILGGHHQYVAIKELIDEGKWKKYRGDKPYVKCDFTKPHDDKHAKVIALKHNTQYDLATKEQIAEWGLELIDSEYGLADIPVMADVSTTTLLDVMDFIGPSDKDTEVEEDKERKPREVECPSCGHMFTL